MNGHHQQNGVENMMLFEVVKMGKSAMQVTLLIKKGFVVLRVRRKSISDSGQFQLKMSFQFQIS